MNAHSAARRENDTTRFGVNWMKHFSPCLLSDDQEITYGKEVEVPWLRVSFDMKVTLGKTGHALRWELGCKATRCTARMGFAPGPGNKTG